MRVLALALALTLALPFAAADTQSGAGVGMDLGVAAVGTWDLFWFATPGGTTRLDLVADQPPIFFSDYDLLLYRPGALDDSLLEDSELVAYSIRGGGSAESITRSLAAGTYVVAVAPYQTQLEGYDLTSSNGDLQFATTTLGTQGK